MKLLCILALVTLPACATPAAPVPSGGTTAFSVDAPGFRYQRLQHYVDTPEGRVWYTVRDETHGK